MRPMADGYWVECVAVTPVSGGHKSCFLSYAATIADLPDFEGRGSSPDQAIARLTERLKKLRAVRADLGVDLPTPHNPLLPPARLRHAEGWMSVYIRLSDRVDWSE